MHKTLSSLPKRLIWGFFAYTLATPLAMANSGLEVSLNEYEGLPIVSRGGSNALTSSFLFFEKNWGWTDLDSEFKVISNGKYSLTAENSTLMFDMQAGINKVSPKQIVWDMSLNAKKNLKDVMGGGIKFEFDLENYSIMLGEPEILPGKNGWSWGKGSNRIEMLFEPRPSKIYFERGGKYELRVFFYDGSIQAGKLKHKITLNIGDNAEIKPTVTERFGGEKTAEWKANILDWQKSPVDLSFLNAADKPAGKRGFIKAKGEQLVFADGTVARFWGTNISAYTLFNTPKDVARQQAKRLSALGFNLVRLHHHDSPWVDPNIFGVEDKPNTRNIDKDAIEQLDWWIKCLKDEGIYIWLDLHVQRAMKPGDNISGFDEMSKGNESVELKGYNYLNKDIQEAMRSFNTQYLNHINTHTGVAYKDDPAVVGILITNENDITNHYGNSLLPDKNVPMHSKLYMAEANKFAKQHQLPRDEVWKSWEHGPSKLFLNDLEYRFNKDMINHLRKLGVKVPIVTTSTWGNNPLSSLPALTAGDIVDVHAYQPFGALEANPNHAANLTQWIAAGQVVDKPISVTEWNAEPFPTADRHTLPLYVASQASSQGWDALMQYAYAQAPMYDEGYPSNWHAYNDPSTLASMPAAALLYRRGDVQEATTRYVLDLQGDLFNAEVSPYSSAYIRTASERGKLQIAMPAIKELPWLQKSSLPAKAHISRDPNTRLLAANATEAYSDNKELKRNWNKGYYVVNTARTQAVAGWLANENFALNDVEIQASTPNATIAVQSLDDQAINASKNIFISFSARSLPKSERELPFRVEPVEAKLSIKAPKGLKLYRTQEDKKPAKIPFSYENGKYTFSLDKKTETLWLFLKE
ncbi:MAG: cellulase family glycosylhydrolase [Bacteroidetes bacterium]|nr:cellulase family glycosylhydrolase [Bacteroidota bacterium]